MNKTSLKRQYKQMLESRDYWYSQFAKEREMGQAEREHCERETGAVIDSAHDEISRLQEELVNREGVTQVTIDEYQEFREETDNLLQEYRDGLTAEEVRRKLEVKSLIALVSDKEADRLSLLKEVKQLQTTSDLHWQWFSSKQNDYQKLHDSYDDLRERNRILHHNFDNELGKRVVEETSSKRWFSSFNKEVIKSLELDRQLHNAWKGNKDLRKEIEKLNLILNDRTKSKAHWYNYCQEALQEVRELNNQLETLENPSLPEEPAH